MVYYSYCCIPGNTVKRKHNLPAKVKVLSRVLFCTNSPAASAVIQYSSQRGNAEEVKDAKRRPANGGSREKESGSDREAERSKRYRTWAASGDRSSSRTEAGARNKFSLGGNNFEANNKLNLAVSKKQPLVSPSPQDPTKRVQFKVALLVSDTRPRECAAGIGPTEAGERDPRRYRARNESQRRGHETEG